MSAVLPSFDDPRLAEAVERLPPGALDELPFGCIRLDAAGVVRLYSRSEAALSGSGGRQRLGLPFFAEVAPCMDGEEFRGRIERARAAGTVDLEFGWIGDFADRERELRVRVQSTASGDGGVWLFLQRLG